MKPTIHALCIGNIINVLLNYFFIFLTGLGFCGCSISTTITRLIMLLYLYKRTKKMSSFVHMKPELRNLVKDTSFQPILETIEYTTSF